MDPPWKEVGGGRICRGADKHYTLLSKQEILGAILGSGLFQVDLKGCHIYCWVTNNHLLDGLWLLNKLACTYVTNIVWVKNRFGLGYYFRGQHEICLFATKGMKYINSDHPKNIPSVIFADVQRHSQKPEEFFDIVNKVSLPPRLEMFARTKREGWNSWGNEL